MQFVHVNFPNIGCSRAKLSWALCVRSFVFRCSLSYTTINDNLESENWMPLSSFTLVCVCVCSQQFKANQTVFHSHYASNWFPKIYYKAYICMFSCTICFFSDWENILILVAIRYNWIRASVSSNSKCVAHISSTAVMRIDLFFVSRFITFLLTRDRPFLMEGKMD